MDQNKKRGCLPMPEAVLVKAQCWLSWVKLMYGKEGKMDKALLNCA
jgi:hypothetical protein